MKHRLHATSWFTGMLLLVVVALAGGCAPGVGQIVSGPASPTAVAAAPSATAASPTATPSPRPSATPTIGHAHTPTALPTETATAMPTETEAPRPTPTPAAAATPHPDAFLQIRPDFPAEGAVFSSGGESVLLYKGGHFALAQASDGALLNDLEISGQIKAFDVSAADALLAVGIANADGGGDIEVYNLTIAALSYTISAAHEAPPSILRFSQDGTTLVSAAQDRKVKLWRVADGVPQTSFTAQTDQITCMAVAPNQDAIVTGSYATDRNVNAWSADGELIAALTKTNSHCYLAAFSPDGAWLVYHTGEKISLYRASDWKREWLVDFTGGMSLANLPERNYLVGFAPDGRLYMGSRKGTVAFMDAASREVTRTLELGALSSFSFSPDGSLIVVVRRKGVVEMLRNEALADK